MTLLKYINKYDISLAKVSINDNNKNVVIVANTAAFTSISVFETLAKIT